LLRTVFDGLSFVSSITGAEFIRAVMVNAALGRKYSDSRWEMPSKTSTVREGGVKNFF
jgi:hypothetical protein